MKFYINNVKITKTIAESFDSKHLINLYNFMENSQTEQPIIINIPGYNPYEVAMIYIRYGGELEPISTIKESTKIMLQIWVYYPELVTVPFHLNDKQIQYVADLDVKLNDDHIKELICTYDIPTYDVETRKIDLGLIPSKNLLKYFSTMRTVNAGCYSVPITMDLQHIREDCYGNIIYSEDPFGKTSDMKVISNVSQLERFIRMKKTKNIYINCDIGESLIKIIQRQPQVPGINLVIPADHIKTWRIGPRCSSLRKLFKSYPEEVDISNCMVEHIIDCNQLFRNAKVHKNISKMYFRNCKSACHMFHGSNIVKCPRFDKIEYVYRMFFNCMQLTHIHLLNPKHIVRFVEMFRNCTKLEVAFTNYEFNDHIRLNRVFTDCLNLRIAFLNCQIYEIKTNDYVFGNCPKLERAFAHCDTIEICNSDISDINIVLCKKLFRKTTFMLHECNSYDSYKSEKNLSFRKNEYDFIEVRYNKLNS